MSLVPFLNLSVVPNRYSPSYSALPSPSMYNDNENFILTNKQIDHQTFHKTAEFIRGLEKKFCNVKFPDAKALKKTIWLVSKQGVSPIQDVLLKKSGYISRLFSNESWGEWLEEKTPLGRVISSYCDYLNSTTRADVFIRRFDQEFLEEANRNAAAILKMVNPPKKNASQQKAAPQTASTPSMWKTFFSFPMAEASPLAPKRFPAEFELSNLNGANGFILNGENKGDFSGTSVSGIGDFNGDGISDLILGAPPNSVFSNASTGRSYVIFGHKGYWENPIQLSSLNGTNGFTIIGEKGYYIGYSVNGAGDINGDGIKDLNIGADSRIHQSVRPRNRSFGSKKDWFSKFELSSLNGTNGFIIDNGGLIGYSVSGTGDINGDGINDLAIGANCNSFVIFGSRWWNSPVDLSTLNGTNGFIINCDTRYLDNLWTVSGAGDINGDGIKDLIIGSTNSNPNDKVDEGRTYVIFGSRWWNSAFQISNLNGTNGFILNGENKYDRSGSSVNCAGDINGDGIQDLILGAVYVGKSYVVFGHNGNWESPFELSSLNGSNGFILEGSGFSVNNAGDINKDGITDLVIGNPGGSPDGKQIAGITYVLFGSKGPWFSPIQLSSLNGINGFMLNGEEQNDRSGNSVSGVGDMNGDGINDLALGAYSASSNGNQYAGKSYVVFGEKMMQKV